MKRRAIAIAVACALACMGILAGCSQNGNENASDTGTTSGTNELVVYYSATGNTERVAQTIAESEGADIFEVTPTEPYSDEDLDWNDSNSRVSVEHDNPDQRDVPLTTTEVPNWDSYDIVFIGYPIWWGGAAWPINGFVTANDFTGKTVIPFCTSASSDIGTSGQDLAELAGTGNWVEGMRFSSSASDQEISDWANTAATSASN
ncbi:MAG: flavodoxin [Coriobacteriales bacterium]|jgi:flavodoxin